MNYLHLWVVISSMQHLITNAPVSFTFFDRKLAVVHKKLVAPAFTAVINTVEVGITLVADGASRTNGGENENCDGDKGGCNIITGFIVNTAWYNLRVPSEHKNTYYSHFANSAKVCYYDPAHFPDDYHDVNIQPILEHVKGASGSK